jgi:hypothetical protein
MYDVYWKVVSHIRKSADKCHVKFFRFQEKMLVKAYMDGKKDIHRRLYRNVSENPSPCGRG